MKSSTPTVLQLLHRRVFALAVVAGLFLSVLPMIPGELAGAQLGQMVTVSKFECPPGFDPSAVSVSEAYSICFEPMQGVLFSLITDNPEVAPQSAQTGPGGGYQFQEISAGIGAYSISEQLPPGYLDPAVYCEFSDGATVQTYVAVAAGGHAQRSS